LHGVAVRRLANAPRPEEDRLGEVIIQIETARIAQWMMFQN
jgi:hypothetical protein